MSTRSHVDQPCSEEVPFLADGRKSLKLGFGDIVFLGMILISIAGLAYEWLR